MPISPEPRLSVASGGATAAPRHQAPAGRVDEVAGPRDGEASRAGGRLDRGGEGLETGELPDMGEVPDTGEVIAAALVRVATHAPPGALVPRGWSGARFGVALQTVSAVSWLSAGRARGAA